MTVHCTPQTIDQAVHDLRNVFCIVLQNLELLRDQVTPGSEKLISRAITGAERGMAIMTGLTAIAKTESLSPK